LNEGAQIEARSSQEAVSSEQWGELITDAMKRRPASIQAQTYRKKKWGSRNSPVLLACSDGNEYVVKGRQNHRDVANDQIVGWLARVIGAPVPETKLVYVADELIKMNPEMQHMPPGLAHGSRSLFPDCTERLWLESGLHRLPANRSRFALLAVLYGWLQAGDRQLIYQKTPPELVFSVDHGHFFPGGPEWAVAGLSGDARADLDGELMNSCSFTREEIAGALRTLLPVGPKTIAEAVAAPPEEWNLTLDLRVAAAQYLYKRRGELLEHSSLRN
jgi:hypothetical protein